MLEIILEVKENSRKLSECKMHDFGKELTLGYPGYAESKIYKCSRCGGMVSELYKRYYDQGLSHARAEYEANKNISKEILLEAIAVLRKVENMQLERVTIEAEKFQRKITKTIYGLVDELGKLA